MIYIIYCSFITLLILLIPLSLSDRSPFKFQVA